MNWSDAISEGLPSPRDDEPGSLRQDLVDELNDHLQSSFQRELRSVPDETQARRNVLARFGDPRQVMNELWYQAMKERIMSQRLMLVLSAVMAAACLAALGLIWMLVQQNRDTQTALLDKIAALAAPQQPTASAVPSDWNSLKVRLTLDDGHETPATGFYVELVGNLIKDREVMRITTDATGVADFGLLRIGQHKLSVSSPSNECTEDRVAVRPGSPTDLHIVCPVPPQQAEVAFDLGWPADIQEKELWIVLGLEAFPRTAGGREWSALSTVVVLNTKGEILKLIPNPETVQEIAGENSAAAVLNVVRSDSRSPGPSDAMFTGSFVAEQVHLPCVDFVLTSISFVRPGPGSTSTAQQKIATFEGTLRVSDRFQPEPGKTNEWKVAVPEQEKLFAAIRERLAQPAEQPAAAAPPQRQSPKNPNPSEWVPVKTRLVLNDEQKSPAVGFYGSVNGHVLNDSQNAQINGKCDENGVIDFGLVRVGGHSLYLYSPSGESTSIPLVVRPGETIPSEYVCPKPTPEVEVSFTMPWPDDLPDKPIWTACQLTREPQQAGDVSWTSRPTLVAFDRSGQVVRCIKDSGTPLRYNITAAGVRFTPDILASESQSFAALRLPTGRYRAAKMVVFSPARLDKLKRDEGPNALAWGDGGPFEIPAEPWGSRSDPAA